MGMKPERDGQTTELQKKRVINQLMRGFHCSHADLVPLASMLLDEVAKSPAVRVLTA